MERKKFLETYWRVYSEWSDLEYRLAIQSQRDRKLELSLKILDDRLHKLKNAYEDSLLPKAISRNPFTGEILSVRIDDGGIDGLWWDYDRPIRPFEHGADNFLALTGALAIDGEIEEFPFKCKPGPDLPFVVKELIASSEVVAVVSQIQIGSHIGYPIAYFTKEDAVEQIGYNFWGNKYDCREGYVQFENPVMIDECDFEIEKWIERGKLFWIAPSDRQMELKDTVVDCPYIDLEGDKRIKTIRNKTVLYEEEVEYELEERQL